MVGCELHDIKNEDDSFLGRNFYLNGEKCSYTSDENNVYIQCLEDQDGLVSYIATIKDITDVYDADTINDVFLLLYKFEEQELENLNLWANIEQHSDGIYTKADIRINGIDAPEFKRQSHGTEDEIERHKRRGVAARDFLRGLIEKSTINNVKQSIEVNIFDEEGNQYPREKYGRVLADIFVYIDGEKINVAQELIDNCHAVAYYGEQKSFDWSAENIDCTKE